MPILKDDADRWFRTYHHGDRRLPTLLCLPHAGGSASAYLALSAALAGRMRVVAVQYPGRQERRTEAPVGDLPTLAARLHAVLAGLPEPPAAYFGHSMGALVAFELLRAQAAAGEAGPRMFFASGRRAPSAARRSAVYRRSDEGIISELRRLGGTDLRLFDDHEIMRAVMPAVRADYRAVETYSCAPDSVVSCPITALIGEEDAQVTVAEAELWAKHTTGPFSLRTLPGGHFFVDTSRELVVDVLLDHLPALT